MTGAAVRYYDRERERLVEEKVLDEPILRWLYETRLGRRATAWFFARSAFSRLYGAYYGSRWSRRDIAPFVARFDVDTRDFEPGPFPSFNAFFTRRLLPGRRPFAADADTMPSAAEGRVLGWRAVDGAATIPIKGMRLTAASLLGSAEEARPFSGGPGLAIRLAPQDYHRFHFVDDGVVLRAWRLGGALHAVNPIALAAMGDILCRNRRWVTLVETDRFGLLAVVEVGAMTVGRIHQHVGPGERVRRGQEKGTFEYGGSTVAILGRPGAWAPDEDILRRTAEGVETFVRVGRAVARRA